MPTLNPLTPEMNDALGKMSTLVPQYNSLAEKSKSESLRDNQDAMQYVDSVIKRYKSIKATSPTTVDLQSKKESFLSLLKQHVAEVGVMSFSKPGDVASRLNEVDFSAESIDQITKGMEQAGLNDDDLATLVTSVVTSETSLLSGSHHHGHPSAYGHFHGHR
ncbi:coiled coil protein [Legionella gratiana]|uniref:Coiled coil protein n=1 Tax=Legionella gratiana TaxID=45066 RepID=A0A378J7N6_9GAMM|nr:hypothetical protein [Legionella gratiana]KTD06157.1 coiled coil protein [Legionella gratiana]STX42981.1 coiled coil protein [Legionella gratiana]